MKLQFYASWTLVAAVFALINQADAIGGIQLGEFNGQHDISGLVTLTSPTTLLIENFNFDGAPPDTFLYYYAPGVVVTPSGGGVIIPLEGDFATSEGGLAQSPISNRDIAVNLAPIGDACDIGTLTLWCRQAQQIFAMLDVSQASFERNGEDPCTLRSPRVIVGDFPQTVHDISGTVQFTSTSTIVIDNLGFDGNAPATFLYVYPPGVTPDPAGPGGTIVPIEADFANEEGGFRQSQVVSGESIVITLNGITICDIGTITLWCRTAEQIFSQISVLSSSYTVDSSGGCRLNSTDNEPTINPTQKGYDNCMPLDDTLQLSWNVNRNDSIVDFKLCGCRGLDPEVPQYMGFGISGSDSLTSMDGADPIIAWIDESQGPMAVDYHLSGRFQCRSGEGVCPDELDARGGCTNDVFNVTGKTVGGQQCVSFSRLFSTADNTCDLPIDPDNENQFIVWAVGGLGVTAFKHFTRADSDERPIHLGRDPSNQCKNVQLVCRSCDVFEEQTMTAREDTTFLLRIGPSGNERGYMGITGRPGWGIAWYVDGVLIPELVVERNQTYTFIVEGGNDPADVGNYHPFYITDSIQGGRLRNTPEERANETVYAGFDGNDNPTGVGRLCELRESAAARNARERCEDLRVYLNEISTPECAEGEPGTITWTPNDDTPDLLYYQCATHVNLGYRIVVTDPLSRASPSLSGSSPTLSGSSPSLPGSSPSLPGSSPSLSGSSMLLLFTLALTYLIPITVQ